MRVAEKIELACQAKSCPGRRVYQEPMEPHFSVSGGTGDRQAGGGVHRSQREGGGAGWGGNGRIASIGSKCVVQGR